MRSHHKLVNEDDEMDNNESGGDDAAAKNENQDEDLEDQTEWVDWLADRLVRGS